MSIKGRSELAAVTVLAVYLLAGTLARRVARAWVARRLRRVSSDPS